MRYGQSRQHYSFWELVQVFLAVYLPSTKFHKYGMICRTTAKEKKPSYSRHIRAPILNRRLNFQSRRFFVFTQTNDDLQG